MDDVYFETLLVDPKIDFIKVYGLEPFTCHIKDVIFNGPATIVFWSDGDKTVVKCSENDIYDPEKGLAMAICKRFFRLCHDGSYYNEMKKWLPKEPEEETFSNNNLLTWFKSILESTGGKFEG